MTDYGQDFQTPGSSDPGTTALDESSKDKQNVQTTGQNEESKIEQPQESAEKPKAKLKI
eukprot:CAMPEP_0168336158 /NCGR_PEP_ID=MMETSP0213-20121227/11364_1 /TAXON_ID=151035 /ORGANISM="Euplotes harpa, Strain FSP1.4" /LENGTH=58 /DNA_ID=CAMNT_0008341275 /DNA_START=3 /DNA_END=176 /DNA_ORIENTATION=+